MAKAKQMDTSPDPKVIVRQPSDVPSIVSIDLNIEGNMTSIGDLQLDGVIKGDVACRKLTVGEGGQFCGTVKAEEVRVHGRIEGQLHAESVTLLASATVIGDIHHQQLEIEAGAYLHGRCISEDPAVQGESMDTVKQLEDLTDELELVTKETATA